jgi:hypothetical protein
MTKNADSLRRDDMRPAAAITCKPRKARRMFAVVSEGRDHGAYLTAEEAQAVADTMPDGYITECLRTPV